MQVVDEKGNKTPGVCIAVLFVSFMANQTIVCPTGPTIMLLLC